MSSIRQRVHFHSARLAFISSWPLGSREKLQLHEHTMTHAFSWVEIPSTEFDRAVEFYSSVLEREIEIHEPDPDDPAFEGRVGMFHTDDGEVGGMIVERDEYTTDSGASISYTPAAHNGILVYLSVDANLDASLSRVATAGGEVLVPKEPTDGGGHYAVITDTEGNRVGLMSL